MGVTGSVLDQGQMEFMSGCPLYFVATAALGEEGHVNCSPRPMDWSFFVDSERRVGWFDMVGSGIETVAHLKENGRIVLMFCSFGRTPLILRIHGRGRVCEPGDVDFEMKSQGRSSRLGVRALVYVEIERVSTSCGFAVPVMEFVTHRPAMDEWLRRKGETGLAKYRLENNLVSIDGLPGLDEGLI